MPGPEKPKRNAIEILILVLTGIVAFYVLITTIFVVTIEFIDHSVDTSALVRSLNSLVSAIIGALLGLIAGRRSNGNNGGPK